jgi:hypothetical protein
MQGYPPGAFLKHVDDGDDRMMNRILWFDAKGEAKYPVFR